MKRYIIIIVVVIGFLSCANINQQIDVRVDNQSNVAIDAIFGAQFPNVAATTTTSYISIDTPLDGGVDFYASIVGVAPILRCNSIVKTGMKYTAHIIPDALSGNRFTITKD